MSRKMIPRTKWRWHGEPGHFVAANQCRFYLHTEIGSYRISTVGDYWPEPLRGEERKREKIGSGRFYETMVFPTVDECRCGIPGCTYSSVSEWGGVDSEGYQNAVEAEAGHMRFCLKAARGEIGHE